MTSSRPSRFGVDRDAVGTVDQLTQHQEFAEEAFSGAGRRDNGEVGVVERSVEGIEQHRSPAGAVQADKHAVAHRQGRADERQRYGERAGVQVARHAQPVSGLRQAAPKAALLLPHRPPRLCQQGIELLLDAPRERVELAHGFRANQKIQTDGEQPLLAALQSLAQAFGVLQRNLALRIGDALAAQGGQARCLESSDLNAERTDHTRRVEGLHKQACFDWQVALDLHAQPPG
jgi:hypothetical protein